MSDTNEIGKVLLKLNARSEEYSIDSSIQDDQLNIAFLLFMIDKLLVDCLDRKTAQAILANSVAVMIGKGSVYTEIENVYKRFTRLPSMTSHDFELECKFMRNTSSQGDHLFVLTRFKPIMVPNVGGKTAIISSLYTMYLRNQLSQESNGILEIAFRLLFDEYGQGSAMPTMTSLTKAPTSVVNKLLNATNRN